jgi:superfamily II DNA helicase RecQ
VLICREHHYAVRNLDLHLRDAHTVTAKDRRLIVDKYATLSLAKPAEVPLPPPLRPPFEALGRPVNALHCAEEECGFISINRTNMRMHCNKEHSWRSKEHERDFWTSVKVQTFFSSSGLQRYFTVLVPEEGRTSAVDRFEADGNRAEVTLLLDEWEVTQQKREREMEKVDAEVAKTDRTGWFNRTGWLEHLARCNYKRLAHASRLPDRDERKLQQAVKVVDLLIERSVAGLSTLAHETRRWLRSAKREEADQRPMARLQNADSQEKYAGYWKQFMCYCLRIIAVEEEVGEDDEVEETDDEEDEEDEGGEESGEDGEEDEDDEDDETEGEDEQGSSEKLLKDARRLFIWQGRQKELAKELWYSLDFGDEKAQVEQMLQLSASFIFQGVGDRPFSSGLIHFLAVLGIDEEMDRLRTAKSYSYMLAGVVYCVRVLGVEALLPSAQRDEQGDAEREEFLRKRRDFLADGSYSPMSTMLSLLAYGKHVALNTGNAGNSWWSTDKKTFYLYGRPIIIRQFQKMARDVVGEAEQMLWQELMWAAEQGQRFVVPLDRIVDDVTFTKRGISFVSRSSNGLAGGLQWMLERMTRSSEGRKMRADGGGWRARLVRKFVRRIDRFLELLLFTVHMTAGQPARGTEITTLRHRNGFLQDRNIFVMDGQVVMVTRYHKSQSQWDKPKVVPRFLPWRVGQLVAVYLAYLQPFREYLTVQVLGGGWSDYVWADARGPWETERLTRVIARETEQRMGNRLTTHDYRHAAVGIGRVVVGESFARGYQDEIGEIEEPEVEEDESPLELQNNRTTVVGVGHYGVPVDIIKHLSVRSLETFRPLSESWHRFLGLASGQENESKSRDGGVASWERAVTKPCWKRGIGPSDEQEVELALPKRRTEGQEHGEEEEVRRAMQQVLGCAEVSFRSMEQERALHAVTAGQTPLVVVLPTGGGKSLLFMVPACSDEPGVTVVVVPYRALVEDLVGRLKRARVDCLEWKPGEVNPAAVVVVSADIAARWDFLNYASLLGGQGLLRRVVIDECHLTFTASNWRPKLAQLKHLRVLACPIVLLTATLPPVLEEELSEGMLVRCATYIRASTVRPKIRYVVSWCQPGSATEMAVATCRRQQRWLDCGRKGVIYCCSKEQCEEIAAELDCAYYHAGVVDRAERLEVWLEKGGFIVATSALGTGVDFPGIVFVLHVGMPWAMIDFAQESGRAGRGGEAVDSVILVEEGEVERRAAKDSDSIDVWAMAAFINAKSCRRGVMSKYLDGKEVNCADIEGTAACDRCGEGLTEWQGSQSEAAKEWQQVREAMDELADSCPVCWVVGDAVPAPGMDGSCLHSLVECRKYERLTQAGLDSFRRLISYNRDSHSCTKCGVSQRFCVTGQETGVRCQWPNVVVPVVRAAVALEEGLEVIRQVGYRGGFSGELKEYGRWLGRRHVRRVWGEVMSNAMVVFIKVILYLSRGGL